MLGFGGAVSGAGVVLAAVCPGWGAAGVGGAAGRAERVAASRGDRVASAGGPRFLELLAPAESGRPGRRGEGEGGQAEDTAGAAAAEPGRSERPPGYGPGAGRGPR